MLRDFIKPTRKATLSLAAQTEPLDETYMSRDALAALQDARASRRSFLKGAGVMIVGFHMGGKLDAQSPVNPAGTVDATQVDSWIAIAADGSVTAYSGKIEFGQGFSTVQTQMVAEELDVSISKVRVIMGITGVTPDQGVTSGSQSTPTEFGTSALRQALATARQALLQLGSQWLDTPVSGLTVHDGVISVAGGDPSQGVSYGDLLYGQRFNLKVSGAASPKSPTQWSVLGTSVPRIDVPEKATGVFKYVQNVRVPGMLHGKVVRPPTFGATVVSVDTSSIAGLPGNPQAVVVNSFVGVVADTEWHALNAANALNVTWSQTGLNLPDSSTFYAWMTQQPSADSYVMNTGDTDANLASAVSKLSAQYLYPYQMHASIGACAAVADVQGGTGSKASAKIWSCTQGVYPQAQTVAVILGIPVANITVYFVEGSGCYGLNGADNVCFDAALLSQAVGKPVRVQYTRRNEMAGTGENYGQPYVMNLTAGMDAGGQIKAWVYEAWTASKGNRPNAGSPGNIPTGWLVGNTAPVPTPGPASAPTSFSNGSNAACNYVSGVVAGKPPGGTGNVLSGSVLVHTVASPFFTGPLRSPSRLQNTFANESFMDEIAASLKVDAVQYRLRHLSDQRLVAVVKAAADSADWITRPSPNPANSKTGVATGRGIACVLYEGNNGYSAMVAEVQVDQGTGAVTVTNLYAAQDSGPVCNPNGLRNQMEGGALQGMSRALYEEVKWRSGFVTSADWLTYRVYTWGMPLPKITTVLVNPTNGPEMGAGECTITLSAAAIGNAVFDATGARLRQVPFTPSNVMNALAARA
jgi:CO/xanthine dehydrogenase Mo-binding subunit